MNDRRKGLKISSVLKNIVRLGNPKYNYIKFIKSLNKRRFSKVSILY